MVTKPVTNLVGGVTKPILEPTLGKPKEISDNLAADANKEKKDQEPMGGKEQTGTNPLGLKDA